MRYCFLFLLACSNLDKSPSTDVADFDGDGFSELNDCDDGNAAIYPTASELCNGIDDNCNGEIDENAIDHIALYEDADGDGYGNPEEMVDSCELLDGYVRNGDDCHDDLAEVYPGGEEICNGIDDNCDGDIDEGVQFPWYADADDDGYGDPLSVYYDCETPEGYVHDSTDCNDSNPEIHPAAPEKCNNIDDDCNSLVDSEEAAENLPKRFLDSDGDGYGDIENWIQDCEILGYVSNWLDCDDSSAAVNPDAAEICDQIDNDCDGLMDDADDHVDLTQGSTTFFVDSDGDGYGDANQTVQACTLLSGRSENSLDCDDTNASHHPDATETCSDGTDNNCDGFIDCEDSDCSVEPDCVEQNCADGLDSDGDLFFDCLDPDCASSVECGEICDDGQDNDLDGMVDCNDTECASYHSSCIANTCPGQTITSELGEIAWGDTTTHSNDVDPACGYYIGTGPDVSVSWEAHVSGCARFDLTTSFDPVLAVYADCSATATASGYMVGGCDSFGAASLSCNVVAGEDYIVVLDGYDGSAYGSYALDVSVQENTSCACQSECCTN